MGGGWMSSVLGLPLFLLYMVVGAALLMLFAFIYTKVTHHDEFALIAESNATAAVALGGSMVGFTIPLAKAITQAISIPDMLIWGVAAFAVQIVAYFVMRMAIRDLSEKIEQNSLAHGVFLAAGSIASGMLNAAAMSL